MIHDRVVGPAVFQGIERARDFVDFQVDERSLVRIPNSCADRRHIITNYSDCTLVDMAFCIRAASLFRLLRFASVVNLVIGWSRSIATRKRTADKKNGRKEYGQCIHYLRERSCDRGRAVEVI